MKISVFTVHWIYEYHFIIIGMEQTIIINETVIS